MSIRKWRISSNMLLAADVAMLGYGLRAIGSNLRYTPSWDKRSGSLLSEPSVDGHPLEDELRL